MSDVLGLLENQAKRSVGAARTTGPLVRTDARVVGAILFGLWLAIVIFATTRHVYWRDEVRALSLARGARTPAELVSSLRNEGHPVLWYFLLYLGDLIIKSPLVLPVISLAVAGTAVAIFLYLSPFPLWFRGLFIFGVLPLHEYSVIARNYGISMLLLFIAAALYRRRDSRPLTFAFVLALLANTNVHSALFAVLLAAAGTWDSLRERGVRSPAATARSLAISWAIVVTGVLLCVAIAWPDTKTVVSPIYSLKLSTVAASAVPAALRPAHVFSALPWGRLPEFAGNLVFYLAVLGLVRRPNLFLAALLAQLGLGMFFIDVYPGWLRHQGLFLIFLITLYWIDRDSRVAGEGTRVTRVLSNCGLYFAMLILVCGQVAMARHELWSEIRTPRSSSKAFGAWLRQTPNFQDAILVPEPAYAVESVPYYAENAIYFPREDRFGTIDSFTTDAAPVLTLGKMLSTARGIRQKYRHPVLLVLAPWEMRRTHVVKRPNFKQFFIWNAADVDELQRSTRLVAEFKSAEDENYRVYEVR